MAKPFFDGPIGVAEENLLVRSLFAFYQLNQRSTTLDLLSHFLSDAPIPALYRLAAVRALHDIKAAELRGQKAWRGWKGESGSKGD